MGPEAGYCEHGDDTPGYIKVWEFIDQFSNYQPLQNNLNDSRAILVQYRFAKLEKLTNNLLQNKRLIVNGKLESKRN